MPPPRAKSKADLHPIRPSSSRTRSTAAATVAGPAGAGRPRPSSGHAAPGQRKHRTRPAVRFRAAAKNTAAKTLGL